MTWGTYTVHSSESIPMGARGRWGAPAVEVTGEGGKLKGESLRRKGLPKKKRSCLDRMLEIDGRHPLRMGVVNDFVGKVLLRSAAREGGKYRMRAILEKLEGGRTACVSEKQPPIDVKYLLPCLEKGGKRKKENKCSVSYVPEKNGE